MSAWTMPGVDEWTAPGYTEERLLGRGVSGRVVAAVNETSGQRVAIKYLDDNLVVRDTEFLRGYRPEAERLMPLDSPHVAPLIDYIEQPGRGAAIVMALVEGVSLREMITRRGPLGAEAALVVLKDSLLGLAAAHSLDALHRDLKPENVLIDAEGWCTLTDFGIAVKTSKRIAAGTPAYMAPELWNGGSSSPATDIYAATAALWESVTGKPPFSGRLRQVRQQHKSAQVPVEQFDQPIQGLIAWGMAKNPADRPQSAQSFADDLQSRAAAAYGPDWEDQGRRELGERAAALLPLLAGGGGNSAMATRAARRKRLAFVLIGTSAAAVLVALAAVAVALPGMSGNAQLTSLSAAATAAQVIVTPPVAASKCATTTTFTYSGTVTATEPGTLSYRWVYSSGKQGSVQKLSFTAPAHRQVSGGTVQARKAGAGWAEIKVLSGIAKTSNKATYRLLCTTSNSGIVLSASVRPKAQTVYSCAAAPPTVTAIGSIKTKKAESVSYYWALADGQDSAARTVKFKGPGTKSLTPLTITPPALPASGEAVLVVTKPVAAASKPATYTVSCEAPVSTVPTAPALATSPASSRSSAGSSPHPGKSTAAPTSKATTAGPTSKPTTAAPTPTIGASSPAPTPSLTPTTASPTTPPPTPTASPTTPIPTES
jgi:tRNA A-37 threonylcarbamoyl transferase component Bud32